MLFFLFLAPVFTCNQAKFRRGQVTPPLPLYFPVNRPMSPSRAQYFPQKFPISHPLPQGSFQH